jgi:TPR repeat protein
LLDIKRYQIVKTQRKSIDYRAGVDRDLEKAEQYYLLSSSLKESIVMERLAFLFLDLGDTEYARMWYEKAIDNGNVNAKI